MISVGDLCIFLLLCSSEDLTSRVVSSSSIACVHACCVVSLRTPSGMLRSEHIRLSVVRDAIDLFRCMNRYFPLSSHVALHRTLYESAIVFLNLSRTNSCPRVYVCDVLNWLVRRCFICFLCSLSQSVGARDFLASRRLTPRRHAHGAGLGSRGRRVW